MSHSPEIDRIALQLFEELSDTPGDALRRHRLTREQPDEVLARLRALEASVERAASALPTLIPGSADCDNALPPPERVGRFRLTRRLGRGGMGDVWLGERDDGLFDQRVAIKLIQRRALARAASSFDDERRFLALLDHPNIARIIDGGVTEDGLPWLAMEFVDGKPLDEACAAVSTDAMLATFRIAVGAVEAAHAQMVAHGDLKPSNVSVDRSGRVRLLDFGLARLIGVDQPEGVRPYTPGFASAERRAGGQPSVADDIYALGRTLCHLLAHRRDADAEAIAAKASSESPSVRYASAGTLGADLDNRIAGLPVHAVPPRIGYRASKFVTRNARPVAIAAVAAAALAASAAVAAVNYVRAEEARREASARFEDARGSAHFVSTELLGRLAEKPGTLQLRVQTAAVAQRYLDRLVAASGTSSAVALDAAEGLYRLAAAQARAGEPNLGQPQLAARNLDHAAALLSGREELTARRLLVRVKLDQARLASNFELKPQRALALLAEADQLLRRDPGAPADIHARYLIDLGTAAEWRSDYDLGVSSGRRALALAETLPGRDGLLLRAAALDLLGEANFYSTGPGSGIKAATQLYRAEMITLEQLHFALPRDAVVARRLARARWALGTTLLETNAKAAALGQLQRASSAMVEITRADPGDADATRLFHSIEAARGQALAATGRLNQGLRLYQGEVLYRGQLAQTEPANPSRRRDLLVAIKALADMQAAHGRRKDGCGNYAWANRLSGAMRAAGQLPAMDEQDLVRGVTSNLDSCAEVSRPRLKS